MNGNDKDKNIPLWNLKKLCIIIIIIIIIVVPIYSFIKWSVLRQVQSLFQSELSK